MTTWSMNQIFKPKRLHGVTKLPFLETLEPICASQAISEPHWREAMSHELIALMRHGTWDLVPPPSCYNLVECKWVFIMKHKPNGLVDMFKARLMAKEYHQCLGVEYKETFILVVKLATI